VADLLGVGAEVEQDASGDALLHPQQAQKEVMGVDGGIAKQQRFVPRAFQRRRR